MAQIKVGGKNASMHLTEKHLVSWLYGVVVFQPLDLIQWLEINSTPPLFCRAILVGKEGEKAGVIARVSGLLWRVQGGQQWMGGKENGKESGKEGWRWQGGNGGGEVATTMARWRWRWQGGDDNGEVATTVVRWRWHWLVASLASGQRWGRRWWGGVAKQG